MIVSVEVPVVRGGWLIQCIDSVLQQSSPNWRLSLRWDGGDVLSRELLEMLAGAGHPRIQVFFGERTGIARARRFLTEHSTGELILPLDDDDLLEPAAVERFIATALERPWAAMIRGRRGFVDDVGEPVEMEDWFPFERRRYLLGATNDLSNHAQPYVFRRAAYEQTEGWCGFADVEYAGEDCSCFATIEEVGEVELLDELLYQYRLHDLRTSRRIELETANELWRRIADRAVERRSSPVRRVNDRPPFTYVAVKPGASPRVDSVEAVIPFWETDEREIPYCVQRPQREAVSCWFALDADTHFVQTLEFPAADMVRISLAISSTGAVHGELKVGLFRGAHDATPALELRRTLESRVGFEFEFVSLSASPDAPSVESYGRLEVFFTPAFDNTGRVVLHALRVGGGRSIGLMRLFAREAGHCRRNLDLCLASLAAAGVAERAMHVIEARRSSSANRNEGFRRCSSPWICFIDDDAELCAPDTLQTMLEAATARGASLAGPRLVTPSKAIYSGQPYTNPLTMETCVSGMGEPDVGQCTTTAIVPWLPSTVLLTHRSVMLSTGGFDENYQGSQHEDADFTLHARSRGFECCYVGQAQAVHRNELRNGHVSANSGYFRKRWKGRPDLFGSEDVGARA